MHGVSYCASWTANKQVLRVLDDKLDLTFPVLKKIAGLEKIAATFKLKSEDEVMDRCIGALDGILVDLFNIKTNIKGIAADAGWLYTRKCMHALNVQAICDSYRRFLWYGINNQGSVHYSTAWMHSGQLAELDSNGGFQQVAGSQLPFYIAYWCCCWPCPCLLESVLNSAGCSVWKGQ